jgi:hypothetical protein
MSLRRARSAEEYINWVEQALFEVGDLRDCFEYEMEEMASFPGFLEPLEQSIKDLHQRMKEGRYQFGREDLMFMDIVHNYGEDIPFADLLKQINETHRKGIDTDTPSN